jgi:hypothetical protein
MPYATPVGEDCKGQNIYHQQLRQHFQMLRFHMGKQFTDKVKERKATDSILDTMRLNT